MKNYERPTLSTFGSVADLTRNYGNVNFKDKVIVGGNLPGGTIPSVGSTDGCIIPEGDKYSCDDFS